MTFSVETVDASVDIVGVDFRATSIEVQRTSTAEAGMAKVSGIIDGTAPVQARDEIQITINDQLIFTGNAINAEVNGRDIYTIQAYDAKYDLHRDQISRSTYENQGWSTNVARRMLDNNDYEFFVGAGTTFDGTNGPTKHDYKNNTLSQVLDDLAARLEGYWWVDEENTVILDDEPPHSAHTIDRIKEVEAGERQASKNGVVVFGTSPTGDQGMEGAVFQTEQQFKSESKLVPTSEKNTTESGVELTGDHINQAVKTHQIGQREIKKTLTKPQALTKNEQKSFANTWLMKYAEDLKEGTVTIVGDENITPWDSVSVPPSLSPPVNALIIGDYKAHTVTHTIEPSNGFVTKIDLKLSWPDQYETVRGERP